MPQPIKVFSNLLNRLSSALVVFILSLPVCFANTGKAVYLEQLHKNNIILAERLKARGVNVIFGPSYDIGDGFYQYSKDPNIVGEIAETVRIAWESVGLIAVPKHFPGLGEVGKKTHEGAIYYEPSDYNDGKSPFEAAVRGGAKAIMVGHGRYRTDGKDDPPPATFSKNVISDLRKGLGFNGVIIADEVLQMSAPKGGETIIAINDERGVFVNRYLSALAAGNDMVILFTMMPEDELIAGLANAMSRAITAGQLSADRLDDSVKRVLELKRLCLPNANIFRGTAIDDIVKKMTIKEKIAQTLVLEFHERGLPQMKAGMYMPRGKDISRFMKDGTLDIPTLIGADQRIHYLANKTDKMTFPREVGMAYRAIKSR